MHRIWEQNWTVCIKENKKCQWLTLHLKFPGALFSILIVEKKKYYYDFQKLNVWI